MEDNTEKHPIIIIFKNNFILVLLMLHNILVQNSSVLYSVYVTNDTRNIIKTINDFTVDNYGDLTDFVNSIPWDNGCVPTYWADASEDMEYDTSEWVVCS